MYKASKVFLSKSASIVLPIILLMVLPMLAVFNVMPVYAAPTVKDLTPDYAKAGSTIDILEFEIVGPTGGATLTAVTVDYTGSTIDDVAYTMVYVSAPPYTVWTLFGWSGFFPTDHQEISGSYSIPESVKVKVKLTITLKGNAIHGHTVDAMISDYTITAPPGSGSDIPPIDPGGAVIV
jgi:hypothetical protein